MKSNNLNWTDFTKVDMRVGTIITVVPFENDKNCSYKMTIDFGSPIGILKTSAQITTLYSVEDLIDKQIVAVVNFPPKQIANMMSECLVLGALCHENDVILLNPERKVHNGTKIG